MHIRVGAIGAPGTTGITFRADPGYVRRIMAGQGSYRDLVALDWFFQHFLPIMTILQSIDISRTQGNNGTLVAELLTEHTDNLRTVKISSTTPN
ncbi:hypothetical protein KI688_005415 [Linnemannia hyalina]|uniref:Uncharacterized protein n=1 Tax=Linnemannia hyalina TaxID=64524 RepID=A0A9P8BNQ9_9FUNG|nr:hypothetical protein KI688_005415 [Linnemannia hyalina]